MQAERQRLGTSKALRSLEMLLSRRIIARVDRFQRLLCGCFVPSAATQGELINHVLIAYQVCMAFAEWSHCHGYPRNIRGRPWERGARSKTAARRKARVS